jgi:hypothetical protein
MYGMIKSDPKLSPKVDGVNAEKTTEQVAKTNSSAKAI